jgi:hypothetical protein
MENEEETGIAGRVTSMEEHPEWFEMSQQLLPLKYSKYVAFTLSDTVEDGYSLFRGVRYRDIPDRKYDFVFVDGPKYELPNGGDSTFDFDFIHVLRSAENPVACLLDKRLSTVFVLQQLLGVEKVKYSAVDGLGIVKPCTQADLGDVASSISSRNFAGSLSVLGGSRLFITNNC